MIEYRYRCRTCGTVHELPPSKVFAEADKFDPIGLFHKILKGHTMQGLFDFCNQCETTGDQIIGLCDLIGYRTTSREFDAEIVEKAKRPGRKRC
tara:strand:- start:7156 stop:7437 length:282 start_codon:yes stop_codon:yes gene_type:complete